MVFVLIDFDMFGAVSCLLGGDTAGIQSHCQTPPPHSLRWEASDTALPPVRFAYVHHTRIFRFVNG